LPLKTKEVKMKNEEITEEEKEINRTFYALWEFANRSIIYDEGRIDLDSFVKGAKEVFDIKFKPES